MNFYISNLSSIVILLVYAAGYGVLSFIVFACLLNYRQGGGYFDVREIKYIKRFSLNEGQDFYFTDREESVTLSATSSAPFLLSSSERPAIESRRESTDYYKGSIIVEADYFLLEAAEEPVTITLTSSRKFYLRLQADINYLLLIFYSLCTALLFFGAINLTWPLIW